MKKKKKKKTNVGGWVENCEHDFSYLEKTLIFPTTQKYLVG